MIPMKFTSADVDKASDDWNFNCGPGALCAVLGMTPDELRPKLGEFEQKGYTNPTLMKDTLDRCGVRFEQVYRSDEDPKCYGLFKDTWVDSGLLRIQWGGPWTKPGVPMRVRYRQTHWIGMRGGDVTQRNLPEIFDINAMAVGGWIECLRWSHNLVPWLLKECCPKSDGSWWVTHVLKVEVPHAR